MNGTAGLQRSSTMDFRSSSSMTVGERICVAFLPLAAAVEALITAFIKCFEYQPRRENCRQCYDHLGDVARLVDETNFSVNEVETLYELFKKLSNLIIDDGLIQKEELQLAIFRTRCGENLILDRVFDIFDQKGKGVLEFEEFVHALSVFHPHASVEAKIEFAFRLFDLRETGYIERAEVKQMVVAILKESDTTLSDDLLEAILDKTFVDVGKENGGKINREEWNAFVIKHPSLLKKMTLPYLKDMNTVFPSFVFTTEVED